VFGDADTHTNHILIVVALQCCIQI